MTNDTQVTPRDIPSCAKAAGIVGTGGAGFPMHVKIQAKADSVIANGAECEPILETDRHFMLRHPEKVIAGLRLAVEATGAEKGYLAVKAKHADLTAIFTSLLKDEPRLELFLLDNFYPAGDEHVLVHEVTGRVVPQGGIPIDVGAVVNNVFTLALLADAVQDKPFTHKYVTVTGEVNRPCVCEAPIGVSIGELIETYGHGLKISDYKIVLGGPMMGKITDDLSTPVEKTTGGIIVVPPDHPLVLRKTSDLKHDFLKAKSVCCQCNLCTDMCPRNLLGHTLYPSRSMRVLPYLQGDFQMESIAQAALCTDCGLCQAFACNMNLSPNRINNYYKKIMAEQGYRPDVKGRKMNPVSEYGALRHVPTPRLIQRLGIAGYDRHLPFDDTPIKTKKLVIPLKMHIGAPCEPLVHTGDLVLRGQKIACAPEGALGVDLHAPLEGMVRAVGRTIEIEAFEGV